MALQFPNNPSLGQTYEFAPYIYQWDGEKWKTIGIGYNPISQLFVEGAVDLIGSAARSPYFKNKTVSLTTGGTLNASSELIYDPDTELWYNWNGTFPKVISAGSTIASSGGIASDAWLAQGTGVLKHSHLEDSKPGDGSAHNADDIGRGSSTVDNDLASLESRANNADNNFLLLGNDIGSINNQISILQSKNLQQDALILLVESKNSEQDAAINALEAGQGSSVYGYATLADLNADLAPSDKSIAYVTNDSTATNNGTYRKVGATGTGSWIQASSDLASLAYNLAIENAAELDNIGIETISADDLAHAITDTNGKMLLGIRENGDLDNPQINRIAGIESETLNIIPVYGQSNSIGAIDYSQTWRIPMPWGMYPTGYAGDLDGSKYITTVRTGVNTWTLNNNLLSFNVFSGAAYGSAGEGIYHGLVDSVAQRNPSHPMCIFSHGVGSYTIDQLDKPTQAEILAGSASGVVIPTTSAEYLMNSAGRNMSYINQYPYSTCATPYYKGMWLIARAKKLAIESSFSAAKVTAVPWLQGEADQSNANYAASLTSLYDNYNADVKLITGQIDDIVMMFETINYGSALEISGQSGYDTWVSSGYTDTSAYIPDQFRVNAQKLIDKTKSLLHHNGNRKTPRRKMFAVAPRYYETSWIHMFPHAARALGEQFGKVYEQTVIKKESWSPCLAHKAWYDDKYVYVEIDAPELPIQFRAPSDSIYGTEQLVSRPYGISYWDGSTIVSIDKTKVKIIGGNVVRIEAPTIPASGHEIRYVVDAYFGSICDSATTTAKFTRRNGLSNQMFNYCLPFQFVL
jgi:hypothetical protein